AGRRSGAWKDGPWPGAAAAPPARDGIGVVALQRAARPGATVRQNAAPDALPWAVPRVAPSVGTWRARQGVPSRVEQDAPSRPVAPPAGLPGLTGQPPTAFPAGGM